MKFFLRWNSPLIVWVLISLIPAHVTVVWRRPGCHMLGCFWCSKSFAREAHIQFNLFICLLWCLRNTLVRHCFLLSVKQSNGWIWLVRRSTLHHKCAVIKKPFILRTFSRSQGFVSRSESSRRRSEVCQKNSQTSSKLASYPNNLPLAKRRARNPTGQDHVKRLRAS